jgi:hypothetical protein
MSIDLNSAEYNASEGVAIFNKGEAGVAEGVTVSLDKKKPEDKPNSPDYKITFTDSSGASCNTSLWYVTQATQYADIDKQTIKQAKILKHMLHCALGPNAKLPVVENATQMLDEAMKMLRTALPKLGPVRVFVNYGTTEYRKKFIQPRSWVPFMESMTVPAESSVLKVSDIDGMERLTEDKPTASKTDAGSTGASDADDEGW